MKSWHLQCFFPQDLPIPSMRQNWNLMFCSGNRLLMYLDLKPCSYYLFHICFSLLSFLSTDPFFHVFVLHIFYCCLMVSVLVSFVYCDKWSQTWWLTQQKFILSQLWKPEVWNQFHWVEIMVSVGLCSLWRLQRICSLGLPACCDCWHTLTCGHITPNSVPWPCFLLFCIWNLPLPIF